MALKTLYFDLGNVLCFFSKAKMIGQLAACSGIEPIKIQQLLIERDIQSRYEKGEIDTKEIHAIFSQFSPIGFDLFKKAITNIFHPNKELWTVVQRLKEKGIRLVLLSNTCKSHHTWISENYPILKLFDQQILSYEVGLLKPDPQIFKKALEFSQCEPHECFYVDDLEEHVKSANSQGLGSERFIDVPTFKRQLKQKFNIIV